MKLVHNVLSTSLFWYNLFKYIRIIRYFIYFDNCKFGYDLWFYQKALLLLSSCWGDMIIRNFNKTQKEVRLKITLGRIGQLASHENFPWAISSVFLSLKSYFCFISLFYMPCVFISLCSRIYIWIYFSSRNFTKSKLILIFNITLKISYVL